MFLLIFPIANFISAEVRMVDSTVYKRGALRIVQRWPASDFARIEAHTRRLIDSPSFDYVVYVFLLRNTSRAFVLSQAWWNVSDIQRLAEALDLRVPKPTPP